MFLKPGLRIKHYLLEKPIGAGASGEVWQASSGGRALAVKFMNVELIESSRAREHRARLENEIRALSSIQHPHIPSLLDFDLDYERPYLVMTHIGGETYDKLIASGDMLQLRMEKRLGLLETIAMALLAVHRAGFVHRDIKPANIAGIDKPYLLDFSIALPCEEALHSRPDVGTGIYMSPEGPADELNDYYGFALVAYELLFGFHPVFGLQAPGRTVTETRQIAGERLAKRQWILPNRITADELPADLRASDLSRLDVIFEKAFGARNQRYRDLLQFCQDLSAAVLTAQNMPFVENPDMTLPIIVSSALIERDQQILRPAGDGVITDHSVIAPARDFRPVMLAAAVIFLLWFLIVGGLALLTMR